MIYNYKKNPYIFLIYDILSLLIIILDLATYMNFVVRSFLGLYNYAY